MVFILPCYCVITDVDSMKASLIFDIGRIWVWTRFSFSGNNQLICDHKDFAFYIFLQPKYLCIYVLWNFKLHFICCRCRALPFQFVDHVICLYIKPQVMMLGKTISPSHPFFEPVINFHFNVSSLLYSFTYWEDRSELYVGRMKICANEL